jgi:hypothetical protein
MLHEFLKTNRAQLIERCQAKAAKRAPSNTRPADSQHGIPQFLDQLIEVFRAEQTAEALARRRTLVGRGQPSLALVPSNIAGTAAKHGDELRQQGLTIDQVVHDYGDLCQAVTELALEMDVQITVDEFHTFNRCLDDAIGDAVTAFSRDPHSYPSPRSEYRISDDPTQALAEELRILLERAIQSFTAIQRGNVGLHGSTAAVHERSLAAMRYLVDRALTASALHAPPKSAA